MAIRRVAKLLLCIYATDIVGFGLLKAKVSRLVAIRKQHQFLPHGCGWFVTSHSVLQSEALAGYLEGPLLQILNS